MPGQIVNISWKEAVSETAVKCGDPFFRDFPKNIYSQAVFRAERSIAKEYGVLERQLTYTNTAGASEFDIGPLNFHGEWHVIVQHPATDSNSEPLRIDYTKEQWERVGDPDDIANAEFTATLPTYRYAIIYNGNRYVFKYSGAEVNDIIEIWYTSSISGEEDYEYFDSEGNVNLIPVLPNKFFEETVRRAILWIAQVGIAQFSGLKAQKYGRLINLYSRPTDNMAEQSLEKDRPWIRINAFSKVFPGD